MLSLTGCKTDKIDQIVATVSFVAPSGKENAVDGYRNLVIKNVGKWNVRFIGLYKEEGILYATSFEIEGMWTRYDGAPFAWPIKLEEADQL
jgi:hypothetical protein